ncbi:MAG: zinc ribbon domain-containing protein [Acidobacteria bacterium]|nr:zinc ribbon domain-containing protein [Acidobacteriota bacterium]
MPLYEYECSACGRRFELLQKFSDEPAKVCIQCGGPVNRLISPSALQFKGSGWYINDYARKGNADASNRDRKSVEGTEKSDPTATQSNSATQPTEGSPKN